MSRHFWPKELKNWPNLFLSAADALRGFIPVQSTVIPPQTELTLMFCKAQLTAKWGKLRRWHQSSAIWTLQQKQKAETTPLPPELQQCLKRAKTELLCLWSKMSTVRKGLEGILDFTLQKQSTNWLFIKVKWKIGYLKAADNFCSLLSSVYIYIKKEKNIVMSNLTDVLAGTKERKKKEKDCICNKVWIFK